MPGAVNALFTKGDFGSQNDGANRFGLSSPKGDGAVDTVHHRLFVADTENHRVLVYNLTVGNALVDRIPDFVLGQATFNDRVFGALTQSAMRRPIGLAYDSVGDRLFVSDRGGHNRILVYNTSTITNGMNAANVLGAPDFTTAGGGATSQSSFINAIGLAYDGTNSRLFVADGSNNRVLVFNVTSITNGQNAVNVLGQTDFVSSGGAVTQAGTPNPWGLAYDAAGSRLFVANEIYNRVMVFSVASITNGQNAVNVLGQADFVSSGIATTQSGLYDPQGIAYDGASRLFVSDGGNNRVMVFDVATITDGEAAANVLGQANFTSSGLATTQSGLYAPSGFVYVPTTTRLYTADVGNNRIMVFDVASITNGQNAVDELGQIDANAFPTVSVIYTKGGYNDGPNKAGLYSPGAAVPDTVHHRLFVADTQNNRVLVYNLSTGNNLLDRVPDFVVGQADFNGSASATTQSGLNSPSAVAYDGVHDRLFVADTGANRVLVFNTATITSGQAAANVLGQANFTAGAAGVTQSGLNAPYGLAYDGVIDRLFVADTNANRVIVHNTATITNGQAAANVLGQANFTSGTAATTQTGMSSPWGTTYDGVNNRLFVAEQGNNRVTVFNVATISNGQAAANVLGQADFVSAGGAATQAGLNFPQGLGYDGGNARLYVSDGTNNRVMIFDASLSGPQNPTLANRITLSRLKVSVSATVTIQFTLQDTLSGPLTVTFPAGFTVTSAATSGASSGCLSGFGFTPTTLTATKASCFGAITLGGATVTNPAAPGVYIITWVNDDPGRGAVTIVTDDQISVNASIDPTITFNVGAQAAATACDGTFAGNGGIVALGTIMTGAVTSSDAASVNHICTRVATNAGSGAAVTVRSLNGGLKSTSVPTDTIPSATGTVVAGTANYGLCAGSAGVDSGKDTTTPAGATPTVATPFNGSCTSAAHAVGALTTAAQNLLTLSGSSQNAFFRLYVKAAISSSTPGHADYADTLTFVATGTY